MLRNVGSDYLKLFFASRLFVLYPQETCVMQGIRLITFDATNTLLKFKIPPWQYYSIVARDFGFTGTEQILKAQMKDGFKKMEEKHPNFGKNDVAWENWWKELVKLTFQGQLPASTDIDIIANKLIDEFTTTKCWTVANGSENLITLLRQNGVCVGVISNFDPRLDGILRNLSLHDKFDFVLTSYDVGFSKPDKRIFDRAMKACKKSVKSSECLHIGDDFEKDYNGARGAGWYALLVASTIKAQLPTAHIFNTVQELCEAFEQNKIYL